MSQFTLHSTPLQTDHLVRDGGDTCPAVRSFHSQLTPSVPHFNLGTSSAGILIERDSQSNPILSLLFLLPVPAHKKTRRD